ncbi:MAG: hypothetical protein ACRDQA_23780, partial [Nocardioidaceae bacterium]
MTEWSGRLVATARAYMARRLPASCGQCGKEVSAQQQWVVGHIKARSTHPELIAVPSNWQLEHRACSDRTGQSSVQAKAKQQALWEAGIFSDHDTYGQSPPLPFSLP